ncbi:hypothetical protein [Rhodocyclus tenuis]|uniref:Uncharacterized protein n=1 Tax=Rhodocyclus tenuis TaxID=1066 RepID=A0A840GET6_RHOTE|nr:hypothetical protein [Rhodocyclus tenuis]MBB4249148.1 hypothetical protein [Rhodocyclus tenuis]
MGSTKWIVSVTRDEISCPLDNSIVKPTIRLLATHVLVYVARNFGPSMSEAYIYMPVPVRLLVQGMKDQPIEREIRLFATLLSASAIELTAHRI